MSIRPIAFFVENSKTINLKFNKNIKSVSSSSFSIKSMDGNSEDLTVIKAVASSSVVSITTSGQKPGYYYMLVINNDKSLVSQDDDTIVDTKIERTVFFTGFERYNPVRDSILSRLPRIFLNDKSIIKDIVSEQAKSIYSAKRSVGELLSDNYIRESTQDEYRVRSSSPLDRLANENAFKITRVSSSETNDVLKFKSIQYGEGLGDRRERIQSTISLQEEDLEQIVYIRDIKENKITLSSNIIKLSSAIVHSNGNIFEYDIYNKKYSIRENKYDYDFSFKNNSFSEFDLSIDKNFLSQFSNYNDYITIKFVSKNREINPASEISFYQVLDVQNEVLTIKKNYFFIKNKNITNHSGANISVGGFEFKNPNNWESSEYFTKEIPYGLNLPSQKGEFSVNYETGEFFVYGDSGKGLDLPVLVSYKYKRYLKENFDYYINEKDLSINKSREMINDFGKITFSYEKVFEEGYHYHSSAHKEVMPESVGSNFTSSFSFKTKNYPITNVFRVVNKTTSEIYQVIDFENDEVFISGENSPKISSKKEFAKFKTYNEKLFVSESYIGKISDIKFETPGSELTLTNRLPSSLFDAGSTYYVTNGIVTKRVSSFVRINNEIVSINIDGIITGSNFYIGTKILKFELSKNLIVDKLSENIGSFFSSSLKLSSPIFLREKSHYGQNISEDTIKSSKDIEEFRLSKEGDYIVDYVNGRIFLSSDDDSQIFGNATYKYSLFDTSFANHMSVSKCEDLSGTEYSNFDKEEDGFLIKDMRSNFDYFDESKYTLLDEENYPLQINDNYEMSLFYNASKIEGVFLKNDVFGLGLLSDGSSYVEAKENILNYNLRTKVQLKNGIVDFKVSNKKTFTVSGNFYRISDPSTNFQSFYSIEGGGLKIESDRVLIKSEIVYRQANGNTIFCSDPTIFTGLNSTYDKVKIGDALYDILSFSSISSTIVVDYHDDISGQIYLAQKGTISGSEISFHSSSGIDTSAQYDYTYIPNDAPDPGTAMVVWYNSGKIKMEYSYLADTVNIYYEYGDNEILWTENGAIEGQSYYVSYEYGALRSALRTNFGLLINEDFFKKFSLQTDREIYRDALEAAMSGVSRGTTKDAISKVTSALSKCEPDISEGSPKGWILGRDHIRTSNFSYGGDMTWGPVRYGNGLLFDKNFLSVRSKNSLSVDEGTVSFWTKNNWKKLLNDSELKINIPQFKVFDYTYSKENNIFSIIGPAQGHGVSFQRNISIGRDNSGVYFDIPNISPADITSLSFKMNFDLSEKISQMSLGSLKISDTYYKSEIFFEIKTLSAVSYSSIKRDFVSSYSLQDLYRRYIFSGSYKMLSADETLIEITLASPVSNIDEKNTFLITNNGYILEIVYGDNKKIIAKQKPINWDGYRYDETIQEYDLTGLSFAKFSVNVNNADVLDINFISERLDINIDRRSGMISINGNNSFVHNSSMSSDGRVEFISDSENEMTLERVVIKNIPYFNNKNIFIGKDLNNPISSDFTISHYTDGIPQKNDFGIYIYTQTNEDYNYDNRAEKYWVVDILKNRYVPVPTSEVSGEIQYSDVAYVFSATINIESESNIYSIDQAGSIVIKESNFELFEDGLRQIETFDQNLGGSDTLDSKTTRYPIVSSNSANISSLTTSATDSERLSIGSGFEIPKFSSFVEMNIDIEIRDIDTDYSEFFDDIEGYSVLSSLFSISNYGIDFSFFVTENELLVTDSDMNLLGYFSQTSKSFRINFEIDYEAKTANITLGSKTINLRVGEKSYENKLTVDITNRNALSGDYHLYYPESEIEIFRFDIAIKNNPADVFSSEVGAYSYGKNAVIEFSNNFETLDNKIYFIAENPKYFFDTDNKSISFFRDYDGFLKLKIANNDAEYTVSTDFSNIDDSVPHHLAASWRTNSVLGSEMHIFVDGEEAPSIMRFGDYSNKVGSVGDISKEFVQDGIIRNISYSQNFQANTIISTDEIDFGSSQKYVGEIYVVDLESSSYYGQAFVIYEINGDRAKVYSLENFEPFIFDASDTITLRPAPIATINTPIASSKVGIFIDDTERGVALFDSSTMTLIGSEDISLVYSFLDLNKNTIQFVKKVDGNFIDSVSLENVYVQNYGLFSENIFEKISFKTVSYKNYSYSSNFQVVSSFQTNLPTPINIGNVRIKKILQDRTSPDHTTSQQGSLIISSGTTQVQSSTSSLLDRFIKFYFESDNIEEGELCTIRVSGISNGLSASEIIEFEETGEVTLRTQFSRIDEVSHECPVVYDYVEPFVFSIEEENLITEEQNVFVHKYSNGEFFISSADDHYAPANLSAGVYSFNYRSRLSVGNIEPPETIFIGSDKSLKFQSKSNIEEFKLTENMSGYSRPNSFDFDNFVDISKEYLSSLPTCPDNSTLLHVPLTDPSETQVFGLKSAEFLDKNTNSKYSFDKNQIFDLYPLMNSETKFVEKMIEYGFDTETAKNTYFKVHKYGKMPFYDISSHHRFENDFIYKSYPGPSELFKGSGILKGNNVILNDKNIINKNKFTIEGWFSAAFDTLNYQNNSTLFEFNNIVRIEILASDLDRIVLPNEAKSVVSVRLIGSSHPSPTNDKIILDEKSGKYVGASGTRRSFSGRLQKDNKTYIFDSILPGKNTKLEVFYYKKSSSVENMRLFLDSSSNIRLEISQNGTTSYISKFVDLSRNEWCRFAIVFDQNIVRFVFNGKEVGYKTNIAYNIYPVLLSVGSRYDHSEKSEIRMSNFFISRTAKSFLTDIDGKLRDEQYFSKLPTFEDGYTSYSLDFDNTKMKKSDYAEITDRINSLFRFEIEVYDNFSRIRDNDLQKLLNKLINNVKPAHVNSIIRYKSDRC
jgi:hypothetical protein